MHLYAEDMSMGHSRQRRSGRMWTKFSGLLVLLAVGITGLTHAQVVHEEQQGPPLSGEEWFRGPEVDALRQVERGMGPADVTQDSLNVRRVGRLPVGPCYAVGTTPTLAAVRRSSCWV